MKSVISRFSKKARSNSLAWRYLYNLAPTLAYRANRPQMAGESLRVLSELNRNGVAMTTVDALPGSVDLFDELDSDVRRIEQEIEPKIQSARAEAGDEDAVGRKTFVLPLLGDKPALDPEWIYARFALQKPVLDIANAYMGMYTRLRHYNVWHTFAAQAQPRESQLWHRDREDRLILKMFVYLSDVTEDAGPLTYVPGSHMKGNLKREPAYFLEGVVRRSTDEQMSEVAPKDKWIKCTGAKGTIVFADTRGYHKGGLARQRDRLMYLCMFTSPASQSQELLARTSDLIPSNQKDLAFALASARRGAWV